MKNILCFVFTILLLYTQCAFATAEEAPKLYGNVEQNLELVNTIGQNILKKNNLPTKIKFLVAEEDHVNAYANIKDEVYVYAGLLKVVENEDELAGVISHEVGHIVNEHVKKQSVLYMVIGPITSSIAYITDKLWIQKLAEVLGILTLKKVSRTAEYEADITGADLMVNAGYNPMGLISLLNKISDNHLDIISTHPSADKRLVYLYDYINYNYPSKSKEGFRTESYTKFKNYMDEVLKQRSNDPEKMAEYIKEQEKLELKRIERSRKIQSGGGAWSAFYAGFVSE